MKTDRRVCVYRMGGGRKEGKALSFFPSLSSAVRKSLPSQTSPSERKMLDKSETPRRVLLSARLQSWPAKQYIIALLAVSASGPIDWDYPLSPAADDGLSSPKERDKIKLFDIHPSTHVV